METNVDPDMTQEEWAAFVAAYISGPPEVRPSNAGNRFEGVEDGETNNPVYLQTYFDMYDDDYNDREY